MACKFDRARLLGFICIDRLVASGNGLPRLWENINRSRSAFQMPCLSHLTLAPMTLKNPSTHTHTHVFSRLSPESAILCRLGNPSPFLVKFKKKLRKTLFWNKPNIKERQAVGKLAHKGCHMTIRNGHRITFSSSARARAPSFHLFNFLTHTTK